MSSRSKITVAESLLLSFPSSLYQKQLVYSLIIEVTGIIAAYRLPYPNERHPKIILKK